MKGRMDGKVAFITGAARGQGRAHAVRLASEGADIIGIDICAQLVKGYPGATEADLDETVRLVEETGRQMVAVKADVRSFDEVSKAVSQGVERFGRLDIVVANAGIFSFARMWEIELEHWQDVIDVNLTGVFHTIKATVPTMIEQGEGGSIILTSSVSGLKGTPFTGAYTAAKHGVTGLCRTLANELGEYRIRVNSIHPAAVSTPMVTDPALFDLMQQHADTLAPIFMNTLPYASMEPADVSAVVAYLASDDSRYTTGAHIPIDFGNLNR
ncbi:MAG TPA: mycofactocin-coupled SDR family oxidoreductase [Acidimicrobiales bacterium]|nr:mycofactocin-coupled SDR family oxidoreductase [Acidimicrobiales bacterium]